ncbi:CYTH domain-containing protein [Croceicoccus mobilis]|uniref:CYTH domain-containing protein n=1 Tax=Croceicoccus mobilis TaxID=1703339 RepID=A0A916Z3M8_9SPHN|nr:CYTH domain-containing protein [Croceicoccus mobilis]GGD74157.1 CYTH domain-containing protein [Croceicoccus mobilis]
MGREIERKYLVRGDGWRALGGKTRHIVQYYLAMTDKAQVRVRIIDDAKAVLTIKSSAATLERQEHEYALPLEEARAMLPLHIGQPVEKLRHRIMGADGHVWEIDEFAGAHSGLVLAEVELADAEDRPVPFDWLGAEVTGDPAFYNVSLAMAGEAAG